MEYSTLPLSLRVALGVVFTIVLVSMAMMALLSAQERHHFLADHQTLLSAALRADGDRLSQRIGDLQRDIAFLARTPPAQGMARALAHAGHDPVGRLSLDQWSPRLAQIFVAFAQSRPDYRRVALISASNPIREILQVENASGTPVVIPPGQTTIQSSENFLRTVFGMPPGKVHVSDISLERSMGGIAPVNRSLLHAATALHDENGRIQAVISIDLDLQPLFNSLASSIGDETEVRIANPDGDYLHHPQAERNFGFEFGNSQRWQDEIPTLTIPAKSDDSPPRLQRISTQNETIYALARRIGLNPQNPEKQLLLVYAFPEKAIDAYVGRVRQPLLVGVALSGLGILALLLWLVRRTFAPIDGLARAAHAISSGRFDAPLPTGAEGEMVPLVTRFHEMQRSLASRAAESRAIVETADDGFWSVDASGILLDVNEAYLRLSGYTREELLGLQVTTLDTDPQGRHLLEQLRRAKPGGHHRCEFVLRRKDGKPWPLELNIAHWQVGDGRYFVFLRDLAEHRQQQGRIRKLLTEKETLLDNALVGIAHIKEWKIVSCNRRFEEFFRCSTNELNEVALASLFAPDENFARFAADAEAAMFQFRNSEVELRLQRTDGSVFWAALNGHQVDPEQQDEGSFWILADITPRKEAEAALLAHQRELESAVEARTADLKASEARARAVLSTMLDGVAHIAADGRIISVNKAACDLFGYGEEEVVGRNISVLMPEPQASAHDSYLKRYAEARPARIVGSRREVEGRRKDGSIFPVELAVSEMTRGGPVP